MPISVFSRSSVSAIMASDILPWTCEPKQSVRQPRPLPADELLFLHSLLCDPEHIFVATVRLPQPLRQASCARMRFSIMTGGGRLVARTTAEARRSGLGLGTTRRRPSARFLPVSTGLPSCGSGARRGNRLNLFPVYQLNRIPHRRRSRNPCLSIRQFEHPDLGTLRFFCSFARPTPTIETYNPFRTNDWALAMSS